MKKIITLVALCLVGTVIAQERYLTKTGELQFEASVPSFEEVKASNTSVTAILNTENGEFAALALVKGFRFKNALMEEHFNENYAESDDYPKAIFKGNLMDFDFNQLNAKAQDINYEGTLEFHGESHKLSNNTLSISRSSDGKILLSGNFKVNVDEFNIEIPKVVSNKLSKTVDVTFSFELAKK
ncbi:YceI family protein [Winogradskyella maritima]|uniref:YceI family protein n=1 Tax=Winogradskyella maritima TaxID=1517766 RepID=A0ABV8AHZ9_9FLAO|nr:YceI family protein [Winogradskyella maritima]